MDGRKNVKKAVMVSFAIVVLVVLSVFMVSIARAQAQLPVVQTGSDSKSLGWAFLAAAIATGFGCVGAGIAVAYVGAAAVGAVGEKPEVAGRTLIFVGLAEGIAIYGLIIAIMILGKV